ncbi:hypothetical protein WJX73_010745 [Symbiochloris irregularis]|uniref:Uncharacterized protein n=1 Tax=Symbiochloris irregularis TaxID=706552 RepID=A0AAW1P6P8_9CHLO
MTALDFKAFRPTLSKVKLLQFHPVQPWLAFSDTNQLVTVWNWATEQVVCEFALPAAEESALQDAHFQLLKAYSSSGIPHVGMVRGLKGHRWLVLACETKVVLKDLRSGEMQEIPRGVLDTKVPTRVAFLFVNSPSLLGGGSSANDGTTTITPIVAVGTSSGTIFLVSLSSLQVQARLTAGHKAAVTSLVVVGAKEVGAPDILVSASADGSIAVWHPSTSAVKLPDKEIAPKLTFKAHDSEIHSALLIAAPSDSPDVGHLYLMTAGEDKRVAVWDAATWKEVARAKPLAKGVCNSMACSPRAGACCGGEPSMLLVSGERPCVWGMYPTSRQLETVLLANLEQLLLPGTKKVPKIYTLACHPLQPHLVAVGANAGVGLLSFSPSQPVPAAPLPLQLPSASDLESPRAGTPFRGCEYLFASDSALWRASFRQGWREDAAGKHLTADLRSKKSVARLPRTGRAEVGVSFDGSCCSVVWPEEGEFAIFRPTPSETWEKVDGGAGIAVAWAASAPTYAVIHTPRAGDAKKHKRKPSSKGKGDEDASIPSAAALAAGAIVQVYSAPADSMHVQQVCSEVGLGGELPLALHGGAMLAVACQKSARSGQRKGRLMRLVSWGSFKAVGAGSLVEPTWMAWDPDATILALGYPDALLLCSLRPTLSVLTSLPLQGTYCGVWQRHQLFVASPSVVHCIFIALQPGTAPIFAEVIRVASIGGGVGAQSVSVGNATAALPTEGTRCAGPVALIGMREGALWLVDARGLPFIIPMSHPGMRARSMAAHGDAAGACFLAEQGLWRHHHDSFARFIAAIAPKGAERALQLSGLTLEGEAKLARVAGNLRWALQVLVAAAVGADDRAALNAYALWHSRVAPGLTVGPLDRLVAGPGRKHRSKGPVMPPLESLVPPAPPPEEEQKKEEEVVPQEVEVEEPSQARRRQLLKILIPEDGELPISDDEPEEEQEQRKPEQDATAAFEAGSESDYDEVDFGRTGRHAVVPDPGVLIDWDQLLTTQPPPAAADDPLEERPTSVPAVLPHAGKSWVLDEATALVDAALIAGDKEVVAVAARLALQAAQGAPRRRQVEVLLQCARCDLLGDVTDAVSHMDEGAAASPVGQAISLAAALADDPHAVTAALQASGLAAAAAMYTHAWRNGDSIKALATWSNGLNTAIGGAAKYSVGQPT